jgi:hypothetical protein
MIVHARFSEQRYFCWAPFDSHNEYEITAVVDNKVLSAKEIKGRYRLPYKSLNPRSIQHVKDIIEQYERTYGRSKPASVELKYTTNDLPQKSWVWKP